MKHTHFPEMPEMSNMSELCSYDEQAFDNMSEERDMLSSIAQAGVEVPKRGNGLYLSYK